MFCRPVLLGISSLVPRSAMNTSASSNKAATPMAGYTTIISRRWGIWDQADLSSALSRRPKWVSSPMVRKPAAGSKTDTSSCSCMGAMVNKTSRSLRMDSSNHSRLAWAKLEKFDGSVYVQWIQKEIVEGQEATSFWGRPLYESSLLVNKIKQSNSLKSGKFIKSGEEASKLSTKVFVHFLICIIIIVVKPAAGNPTDTSHRYW